MINIAALLVVSLLYPPPVLSTPQSMFMESVDQYCERREQGTNSILPVRVGKAGPKGEPGAKGEPGNVDYSSINATIDQMIQEQFANVTLKVNKITEAIERIEQSCKEAQQGTQTVRDEVTSVLALLGWRRAINGMIYRFVSSMKTWIQADADCKSQGARLVAAGIRNATVQSEIMTFVNSRRAFWIGLTDRVREGVWKWEDGVSASSSDPVWYPAEPNDYRGKEDCACMFPDSGSWLANDIPCEDTRSYLCEKSI